MKDRIRKILVDYTDFIFSPIIVYMGQPPIATKKVVYPDDDHIDIVLDMIMDLVDEHTHRVSLKKEIDTIKQQTKMIKKITNDIRKGV